MHLHNVCSIVLEPITLYSRDVCLLILPILNSNACKGSLLLIRKNIIHVFYQMPGRGGVGLRPKKKAFKPKQQKKRFIRSKDPILAVLMWGVQHSVSFIPYACLRVGTNLGTCSVPFEKIRFVVLIK